MQGRCGKVAAAAGGALRRRTVAALLRFGALLEPGEAIKPLKQLLRVCRVVLAERGPSRSVHLQRQLLSYHARTAALRSGGRQKLLPRVTLLRKLHLRHLQRLAASAFGCGSRCAELLPLVDLQLRLSTHRYAKVLTLTLTLSLTLSLSLSLSLSLTLTLTLTLTRCAAPRRTASTSRSGCTRGSAGSTYRGSSAC